MTTIYEIIGRLYFNTYNYLISNYNTLHYKLFDVQKIESYCTKTNRLSNIYVYYILMKICKKFQLNLLIDLINYITYEKDNLYNLHIKTKVRECKFIYNGNLFDLINFMNINDKYIKHQINLPNKYIIRSCELNNHKDIHHLLYLYYDPELIFPKNTIIDILNVNKIKHDKDDALKFQIFKGRPYTVIKNISDLTNIHINIINELI
jgi:hypothetical protein